MTGCYAHHFLEGLGYGAIPSKVGGLDQFVSVVTRVLFLPTCCKHLVKALAGYITSVPAVSTFFLSCQVMVI